MTTHKNAVNVSSTARPLGFVFPVYVSRRVWETFTDTEQLLDVLWKFRSAIENKSAEDTDTGEELTFTVLFRTNGIMAKLITFRAVIYLADDQPIMLISYPNEIG